jgi:hypothetical protein
VRIAEGTHRHRAHRNREHRSRTRAPSITETGYRSHFTSPDTVAAYGGPVAFVEAWLETESQAPDWRREEQQRWRLSLF